MLTPVEEGNVGGGTPMIGYGLKGDIGTSSRVVGPVTVGVLVQLNCGRREDLTIDGVPVRRELRVPKLKLGGLDGSIMIVVATDLSLESRQLWKVAKRAVLGLARTGSFGGATEEAIINALFKAETMVGVNGNVCYEPPLEEVARIFEKYGR